MAPCRKLILIGNPNVGKSALFNQLTRRYVTVSNYPGTTVSMAQGITHIHGEKYEVIDTPGMYSLHPMSDDEKVARRLLFDNLDHLILHVIDAKNIDRMLGLSLQLIEMGAKVVIVLNIIDEATKMGIDINEQALSQTLKHPVVKTVSTTGWGIDDLKEKIHKYAIEARVEAKEKDHYQTLLHYSTSLDCLIAVSLRKRVDAIISKTVTTKKGGTKTLSLHLDRLIMHPVLGYIVLGFILYYGLYQFVGVLAAGELVDFIESTIFESHINPWVTTAIQAIIPFESLQTLFVGDYGIFTLGIRYAVALVLPIVGAFFLVFSIIEDTGYLPRLAFLLDRTFKKIGLNGKAVIPLVLGLGCDTMATMVTRVLETKREKIIVTILLALAIPCSAQLGLILAILSKYPSALLMWSGVLVLEFIIIGYLSARVLPGEKPHFIMELPPLRFPTLSNIFSKTSARMRWYFVEVFPLFILASVLIWGGILTGLFQWVVKGLEPLMSWVGLPAQMAVVTLFGFFRRDYGAAGLFDLASQGVLTPNQLAIAAVMLTLFLPCIAQFLIMKKERGLKTTLLMCGFVFLMAGGTGFLIYQIFEMTGFQL